MGIGHGEIAAAQSNCDLVPNLLMPILYNQMYEYAAIASNARAAKTLAVQKIEQVTQAMQPGAQAMMSTPAHASAAGATDRQVDGKKEARAPATSTPPVLPYTVSAVLHVLTAAVVVPWAFRRVRQATRS